MFLQTLPDVSASKLTNRLLCLGSTIFVTGCTLPRTDESMRNYSPSDWLGMLTFIGVIAFVYMLPTVIALFSRHPATLGIGLLNLTLGWSGIVWVATFIWAFVKPVKPVTIIQQAYPNPRFPADPPPLPRKPSVEAELESLIRLKERQLISEEEFSAKRTTILKRI